MLSEAGVARQTRIGYRTWQSVALASACTLDVTNLCPTLACGVRDRRRSATVALQVRTLHLSPPAPVGSQ